MQSSTTKTKISAYIKNATEKFLAGDFDNAFVNYSMALELDNANEEGKAGVLLCNLAKERANEASALFEFYLINKENKISNAEELLMSIIDEIEKNEFSCDSFLQENEANYLEQKVLNENGIDYKDFMKLVQKSGDFKKTFESIMFSTRVIIHKKEYFVDFLMMLFDNGFEEIAFNYFETAIKIYPNDIALLELIKNHKSVGN